MMPVFAVSEPETDFIFGLDMQFLFDALIFAIAMMVLYALLSYLLFNPARNLMKKRQEMIDNDIKQAMLLINLFFNVKTSADKYPTGASVMTPLNLIELL